MITNTNEIPAHLYPSRARLFFGFLGMAFASLIWPRDAAEVLAIGVRGKEELDAHREADNG